MNLILSTRHGRRLGIGAVLGLCTLGACASAYRPKPLSEPEILARLDEPVPNATPSVPSRGDAVLGITLEQAQALAIARHPTLRRLRAERGVVDAADVHAESSPDPELSASLLWITPQGLLGGLASLRWEILAPGTEAARRGLAGALRESFDARLAAEEWRVAAEARVAWLELAAREREAEIAEQRLAASNATWEFAGRMLDRGATTTVETTVVDLEAAEAERDRTTADGALRSAVARLATAAALPPGSRIRTSADEDPLRPIDPLVPAGEPDLLLRERLPEIRDARSRYVIAERELELACLGGLARFSVGPDAERDTDSTKIGAGGTVVLPVTDANRAAIVEATARREIAARELEIGLFEARARLSQAREEETATARALAVHENRVAPAAEAALASAEKASDAGAADLMAVLLARQHALQARQAGVELGAAHAVAVARLEAAFGPEPPSKSSAERGGAP